MDERRKAAYRFLLYRGLLYIRGHSGWAGYSKPGFWRSLRGGAGGQTGHVAFHVSDALHNLARFSARDFGDFDEDRFWRDVEGMRRYGVDVDWFRQAFEQALAEKP